MGANRAAYTNVYFVVYITMWGAHTDIGLICSLGSSHRSGGLLDGCGWQRRCDSGGGILCALALMAGVGG